jgi:hypothetical protein
VLLHDGAVGLNHAVHGVSAEGQYLLGVPAGRLQEKEEVLVALNSSTCACTDPSQAWCRIEVCMMSPDGKLWHVCMHAEARAFKPCYFHL